MIGYLDFRTGRYSLESFYNRIKRNNSRRVYSERETKHDDYEILPVKW